MHHRHARSHRHGFFLVVRHHQAGDADLLDDVHQLDTGFFPQLAVQRSQRFVQKQQLRLTRQTSSQRHPLLLPAGELMRLALRQT